MSVPQSLPNPKGPSVGKEELPAAPAPTAAITPATPPVPVSNDTVPQTNKTKNSERWLGPAVLFQGFAILLTLAGLFLTTKQLRQNDQHLRISQRPWVGPSGMPKLIMRGDTGAKLVFNWKNFGQSPALYSTFQVGDSNQTSDQVCASARDNPAELGSVRNGVTIFPSQETGYDESNAYSTKVAPGINYVFTCISYTDEFNQQLETRSCYQVIHELEGWKVEPCYIDSGAK